MVERQADGRGRDRRAIESTWPSGSRRWRGAGRRRRRNAASTHGRSVAALLAQTPAAALYSRRRGCGVAAGDTYPRGLTILKGAVPDRARGLGYTAPTYAVGFRDRNSTGHRGLAPLLSSFSVSDLAHDCQRRQADARGKSALRADAHCPARPARRRRARRRLGGASPSAPRRSSPRRAAVVAGYLPIRSEVDPRPIIERGAQAGDRRRAAGVIDPGPLRLPPLRARRRRLSPAASARVGPPDDAPIVEPDIIIVPLSRFDRAGTASATARAITTARIARAARPRAAAAARRHRLRGAGGRTVPPNRMTSALDCIVTENGRSLDPRRLSRRRSRCAFCFSATSSAAPAATP